MCVQLQQSVQVELQQKTEEVEKWQKEVQAKTAQVKQYKKQVDSLQEKLQEKPETTQQVEDVCLY